MYQKVRMKLLAVRIEWHWLFIMRVRKKVNLMIGKEIPFTSAVLLRLDKRLNRHCGRVTWLTHQYEELANINQGCQSYDIKEKELYKQS